MALKQSTNPYGYRELLVYKKAEEMQQACASLTALFPISPPSPHFKTLSSLADQMDRSARSVKQNIVEGWKRNSTKEYHQFLGFSLGANAELEEDCNDIIKGVYKGIEREKGDWEIERVEKLPFYPLDTRLPLLIQLKLRCKELNMLLDKLQKSLVDKMSADHTLPQREMQSLARGREDANDAWIQREREKWEKTGEKGGEEKGRMGEMGERGKEENRL